MRIIPDGFNDLPPRVTPRVAERLPGRINIVIPHFFQNGAYLEERARFREHHHIE
jgi:hypothetical protein